MSNKLMRIIMPVICILWIGFIFVMSSDVNSNKKTVSISAEIHEIAPSTNMDVPRIELIIRKMSHFFEFIVLCLLLLVTGEVYQLKLSKYIIYILFLCLLVANIDEFIQEFIPGRTSQVQDCLIDFAGSLIGLVVFLTIKKIFYTVFGMRIKHWTNKYYLND